jgi:transposase
MMQLLLDELARSHAISGKRIVLVLDSATAHRVKALRVPERLTLVGLPAYRPELNPTGRLWPMVKQGIANRTHSTLERLKQEVCTRCQRITTAEVAALTNYHWWPTA